MTLQPRSPGLLDKNYLTEIGRIITSFSYLDKKVDEALWGVLNLSEREGRAITGKIVSVNTRIDMFFRIAREASKDKKYRSEAHALQERLAQATRDRNTAGHAIWWQISRPDYLAQCERYQVGGLEPEPEEDWTLGRLETAANEIEQLSLDLISFAIQVKRARAP